MSEDSNTQIVHSTRFYTTVTFTNCKSFIVVLSLKAMIYHEGKIHKKMPR